MKQSSVKRRYYWLGLPCAAVAVAPFLILHAQQSPFQQVTLPSAHPEPKLTTPAKPPLALMRLNQHAENIEKGVAIHGDLALKGSGKGKFAFLTFDDGPSPITPRVLKTLEAYNVKATFFLIGGNAKNFPSLVKQEYDAGHAIANHSYTHNYRPLYRTPWTMMAEIGMTEKVFEQILGPQFKTKLFRFPGGYMGTRSVFHHHKEAYAKTIADCGMHFLDWNVDCGDTNGRPQSPSQLASRVLAETSGQNRVVILMHDAAAKHNTASALPAIIEGLKKRGYVFRTLQ